MPRYFFHIRDGQDFPDDEGTVLDDDAAARAQAVVTAGSMLADKGETFWVGGEWHMTVVDVAGRSVCELRFSGK